MSAIKKYCSDKIRVCILFNNNFQLEIIRQYSDKKKEEDLLLWTWK